MWLRFKTELFAPFTLMSRKNLTLGLFVLHSMTNLFPALR